MTPAHLRGVVRNLSIRRKLTAIVMVTSGVAVILASALFLAYDYNSFRRQMVTDLDTTAEGLGLQAYPALDVESASGGVGTQTREALAFIVGSLRAYPSVEHAVIFDANGRARGARSATSSRSGPLLPQGSQRAGVHPRGPVNSSVIDSSAYVLRNTRRAPIALDALAGLATTGNVVAEYGRVAEGMGVMGFLV